MEEKGVFINMLGQSKLVTIQVELEIHSFLIYLEEKVVIMPE